MAFTLYSGLVWTGLDILHAGAAPTPLTAAAKAAAAKLRGSAAALALVVAATAASGAFVAGNDAGHAFNDWPFFAGRLVPEGIWQEVSVTRRGSALARLSLHVCLWVPLRPSACATSSRTLPLCSSTTACLPVGSAARAPSRFPVTPTPTPTPLTDSTLAAVGVLHARVAAAGGGAALPAAVRTATRVVAGVAGLQLCLGISTLLLYVPVSLGAAHQAGALALLTAALATLHSLKVAAQAPLVAQPGGTAAAAAAGAAARASGGGKAAAVAAALALLALPREPDSDCDC